MKYFLIFFCLCLLSFSCKKEKKVTHVKGIVLNEGNNNVIDSATVILKDGIASGSGWFDLGLESKTSSGNRASTVTNANGEFELEIEGEFDPVITTRKEGFFPYEFSDGGSVIGWEFVMESTNEIKLYLKSESHLGFNLVTEDWNPATDSLWFYYLDKDLSGNSGFKGYSQNGVVSAFCTQEPPFSERERLVAGDRYQVFGLYIRRNGVTNTLVDSVFIAGGKTKTHTVKF
jgi:hypothetical protein